MGVRGCVRGLVQAMCPCCCCRAGGRSVDGYAAADEVPGQEERRPAAGVPLLVGAGGEARLAVTQHCAGPGEDAAVPLHAEVVRVLYQRRGAVAVLQVVLTLDTGALMRACLKIRTDAALFARERDVYWQMRQGGCAGLFVRLHFFCTVRHEGSSAAWVGYCMDMAEHSVVEILSARELQAEAMVCGPSEGRGGVSVRDGGSVHDGVLRACLEVLRGMHAAGWVHGDSHAGNFMYCRGRVYAIDFERSFRSEDAVQHLLDLQELFGHVVGVLTDVRRDYAWDMQHMLAIYSRCRARADDATPDGLVTSLLPMCGCFTEAEERRRLRGCRLCRSAANRAAAQRVRDGGDAVCDAVAAVGLGRIRVALMKTRLECMRECRSVVDIILRCFADPAMHSIPAARAAAQGMGQMQRAGRRGRGEPSERSACTNAAWVLLYAPALDDQAAQVARDLVQGLREGGYHEEADVVLRACAAPIRP